MSGYCSPDPTLGFLGQYQSRGHPGATAPDMFNGLFQEIRTIATLDVNGEATWTFPVPYPSKPVVNHIYEEAAGNLPIIVKIKGFTQDGSLNYTAVTIKAYRLQTLPASLTVLTTLQSFDISAGVAPQTILIHLVAGMAS